MDRILTIDDEAGFGIIPQQPESFSLSDILDKSRRLLQNLGLMLGVEFQWHHVPCIYCLMVRSCEIEWGDLVFYRPVSVIIGDTGLLEHELAKPNCSGLLMSTHHAV